MKKYTKMEAIAIVTSCALAYQKHLANRSLLFLCLDNHRNAFATEVTFDASNFLHLTGLKPCVSSEKNGNTYKLSPLAFYNRCLTHRLSPQDFSFAADGTTHQKLSVLPFIMNAHLSATMLGDCTAQTVKLYTEKLVGGVKACVGFVADKTSGRYVPNTVLQADIREYCTDYARVIAVFRKQKQEAAYAEVTYRAQKVDWNCIKLPEPHFYLLSLLLSETNIQSL